MYVCIISFSFFGLNFEFCFCSVLVSIIIQFIILLKSFIFFACVRVFGWHDVINLPVNSKFKTNIITTQMKKNADT